MSAAIDGAPEIRRGDVPDPGAARALAVNILGHHAVACLAAAGIDLVDADLVEGLDQEKARLRRVRDALEGELREEIAVSRRIAADLADVAGDPNLIARVAAACPDAQVTDAAGAAFAVGEMRRELDRVEARVKVLEERQERAVDVLRGGA